MDVVFHRQHKNTVANFSRCFITIAIKCGAFSNRTFSLVSEAVNNHFQKKIQLLATWNVFIEMVDSQK